MHIECIQVQAHHDCIRIGVASKLTLINVMSLFVISVASEKISYSRNHADGFHYETYGEISPSRTLPNTFHCSF